SNAESQGAENRKGDHARRDTLWLENTWEKPGKLNATSFMADTALQVTWLVQAIFHCARRAESWLVDTAALPSAIIQEIVDAKGSAANLPGLLHHHFSPARESRKQGWSRPRRAALPKQSRAARSCYLPRGRICRFPRKWFQYAQSGNAPSPQTDARMPPC